MDERHGKIMVSYFWFVCFTTMKKKKLRVPFVSTDSMDKLRAKRPEFEHVFYDASEFKEMYKYTFTYAKNRDQKCMEIEVFYAQKKKRKF